MEPLKDAIQYITDYATNFNESQSAIIDDNLLNAFTTLRTLCHKSCQYHLRNRKIVIYDSCLVKLYYILNQSFLNKMILEKLLETLIAITKSTG